MYIRRSAAALALVFLTACGDAGRAEHASEGDAQPMPQGAELDPAFANHLPPGATFEEAQLGLRLFTPCTVCHGPDAGGTQLGPPLNDGEWIVAEPQLEQVVALIRDGVPQPGEYPVPMPPHGGGDFDEAELRALAVYVITLANRGEQP
jgi:mono/diheme cytochrome c family protein